MIPGSRTSAFLWLAGTVRMSEVDITGVTAYSFAQVTRAPRRPDFEPPKFM